MTRQAAQSMQVFHFVILTICMVVVGFFSGCDNAPSDRDAREESSGGTRENITASERAEAAKLKPAKDPISEEIYAFRGKTRDAYNNSRFDELEVLAAELRRDKPLFANGSWKIVQFYSSFDLRDDEGEEMWKTHEGLHQQWIAAKPASITARVAHADFLASYAWQARGADYADKVTENGWRLLRNGSRQRARC